MRYRYQRQYCGPLQAVVFDLAGTVVDYGSRAPVEALKLLFAKQGMKISEDDTRAPMGSEKRAHIARMLALPGLRADWIEEHGEAPNEATIDRLFTEFEPIQLRTVTSRLTLIPGAAKAIRQIRDNELCIGFNTGYSRAMAQPIIDFLAQQDLAADSVVCGPEVPLARPAPHMVWRNLIELGVDNVAACVKVDDAESGIEEGLNAGMWTVAVAISGNANGMDLEQWIALGRSEQQIIRQASHQRLARSGAHFVIDSVADLLPCLEQIQNQVSRGMRP